MNYGQFLNMIPEATLVVALVIIFLADFALNKSERKHPVLRCLTHALLLLQLGICLLAHPAEAFGGMYVATAAANVMKVILTAGALVVCIMAQTWVEGHEVTRRYEGEFYMLIVSTLLGMYMMMSSGHFLMFFLGLEMASVPMASLVAMDKWKKNLCGGRCQIYFDGNFFKCYHALWYLLYLRSCRNTLLYGCI